MAVIGERYLSDKGQLHPNRLPVNGIIAVPPNRQNTAGKALEDVGRIIGILIPPTPKDVSKHQQSVGFDPSDDSLNSSRPGTGAVQIGDNQITHGNIIAQKQGENCYSMPAYEPR